jgi:predicted acyltransferase
MTVYSVLILAVPVPGNGAGDLSIEGNLATHIDSAVFGTHNYRTLRAGELYWEPEGLLSTLPAIGTTLLGALTGLWLRSGRGAMQKAAGLFAAGVVCAVLGYVLDGLLMPINKGLWTPAYVFLTAGFALLGLGLCYWLIDVHRYQKWSKLLMIFGMNALAMFVLAAIVSRVMVLIAWADEEGKRVALRGFLYNTLYTPLFKDPKNASLAWAISYVLVFLLIALALYRKRIFIKV